MKVICIATAALCVAAVSSMAINNYGGDKYYGQGEDHHLGHVAADAHDYGNGGYKAAEDLRRYGRYDNAAKAYNNAGDRYAAHGNHYRKAADKASAKGDAASRYYGKKTAAHGEKAYASAAHANKAGYNDDSAHKYAQKADASKAAAHDDYANNNYYRKGDVFNSGVHYGFDKKYNKKANDDGDYEILDDSNEHNLDEYRDRTAAFKKANRKHLASKHVADAAHALKDSKYGKDARQAHHDNGKYQSAANHAAKTGAGIHAFEGKLNEAGGSDKYYAGAHDAARNKYDNYAGKNAYHSQKNAANAAQKAAKTFAGHGVSVGHVGNTYANGYGKGGDHSYGQRYADHLGHSGHHGHVGNDDGLFGSAAHGVHEDFFDAAANAALARSGKYGSKLADYQRVHSNAAYNRNGHNNAQDNDYYKSGAAAANKKAFHNQDDASAAAKHGYSHDGAEAGSRYDDKAAVLDSDNSAFAKDNFKRNYHDAAKKHHLVKKFHHHSDAGGNNYERLNYDRKDYRDNFGQNANAAHSDAKKTAQNYYKAAAKASDHHNNKQVADKASKSFNSYNAANAANGKASQKSKYYNRNAALDAGANNQAAKAGYSKHNIAAAGQAHKLNDYARNEYGNDRHAFNTAHGAAAHHGDVEHHAGVGYGHGIENRVFGLDHGVVGLGNGVGHGVVGLGNGVGHGVVGLGHGVSQRVVGLGNGYRHGLGKGFGVIGGFGVNTGVGHYPYY